MNFQTSHIQISSYSLSVSNLAYFTSHAITLTVDKIVKWGDTISRLHLVVYVIAAVQ